MPSLLASHCSAGHAYAQRKVERIRASMLGWAARNLHVDNARFLYRPYRLIRVDKCVWPRGSPISDSCRISGTYHLSSKILGIGYVIHSMYVQSVCVSAKASIGCCCGSGLVLPGFHSQALSRAIVWWLARNFFLSTIVYPRNRFKMASHGWMCAPQCFPFCRLLQVPETSYSLHLCRFNPHALSSAARMRSWNRYWRSRDCIFYIAHPIQGLSW